MRSSAILAIDQGTTGTRAILYNKHGSQLASAYQEFSQYYPQPGWVEHDPLEIWDSTRAVISLALRKARISSGAIAGIGITNQRETTILWDKHTGRPVYPAIVWQDRRTAEWTTAAKRRGLESQIRRKTGLVLDPYFSGSKIAWLLDHIKGLRKEANRGRILFGTIDTWLLWKLTAGKSHKTDFTNASRTLLYNIRTKKWDNALLKSFRIPKSLLPEVQDSGSLFGRTVSQGPLNAGIPIFAIMGDQQAALYGQGCYQRGQLKNTYGTGSFVVLNLGKRLPKIPFGLLATLACDKSGKPVYALEGSVFISGAAIQWLRDGLQFFKHAGETERMTASVSDTGGVVFIPSLAGLGSPYWDPSARGMITGITRGTKRAHIVRATLEALAQQSADVVEIMKKYSTHRINELKADGGATANRFLMQFQSDLLGIPVHVSDIAESTAWGVAKLAGFKSGLWPSLEKVDRRRKYKKYRPRFKPGEIKVFRSVWKREIARLLLKP